MLLYFLDFESLNICISKNKTNGYFFKSDFHGSGERSGDQARGLFTSRQLLMCHMMWPQAGHPLPLSTLLNASWFLEIWPSIIPGVPKSQGIVRAFSSGTSHPLKVGSLCLPFPSHWVKGNPEQEACNFRALVPVLAPPQGWGGCCLMM